MNTFNDLPRRFYIFCWYMVLFMGSNEESIMFDVPSDLVDKLVARIVEDFIS